MNDLEKIGKKLRKARKELNLKQSEVADKVGINSNYYARIERGEVQAALDTLKEIAKILKIKLSDILPF